MGKSKRKSKTARIMELANSGKRYSTAKIAAIVGCSTAYVRVVKNQRKGSSRSAADLKYAASEKGKANEKRVLEKRRILRSLCDRGAANEAFRKAYRKARRSGASIREAAKAGQRAHYRVMRKTTDHDTFRARVAKEIYGYAEAAE